MASYDTWIKQYRPDENTSNTSVNYYPKGAVIAFLLDAKIRKGSGGQRTLDDGADGLVARLDQYKPGDKVAVLVARRDKLTKIEVTLGTEPGRAWRLEVLPTAAAEQQARLTAWMGK